MNLRGENIRLLYLPNEGSRNGKQVEGRQGFEGLLANGELNGYEVFSFWDELEACGDPDQVDRKLLETAARFRPTMVLWQHPAGYPVNPSTLQSLKSFPSRPLLIYDERDPYVPFFRPLPPGAKTLSRYADVVFSTGLGIKSRLFHQAGARRVYYSPTCMDAERFAKGWKPLDVPVYDVVMITNVSRLNLPFLRLPGTKERLILADRLWRSLGERFAVFGHHWPRRPYVKGPLEFEKQTSAMQQALVSVGWDRFEATPYYFSDRLPIAMLSGVPHVTNTKPGFEQMFRNGVDLFYAETVDEVASTVMYLLSMPKKELVRLGRLQHEFAIRNLTPVPVFRNLLTKACEDRRILLSKR